MTESYKKLQALIFENEGILKNGVLIMDGIDKEPEELLSEDIGLERVLRALGDGYLAKTSGIYEEDWHSDNYHGQAEKSEFLVCDWTLTLPLHEQAEETILKLIEILS